MSTTGSRNYRPNLHFTPPAMWTNDPNGMVYVNGVYHLFYQHYPKAPHWGPMHWGHAVSRDLLHWEHQPIALYPDEMGYIYSGSCVYDKENVSGYGTKEEPPLVALYTNHDPDGEQRQCLAYSTDGVHFEKTIHNPVIPNPGISDFRDPKVFYNPVKNCWSLVLAAKDRVHFYQSADLKHWEKTGEFGPEENLAPGIWECPDLFQARTEDGDSIWVLVVSMLMDTEDGRSRTQYFLGDFDGDRFFVTEKADEVLWLDFGFDNYAGVIFQNMEEPVLLGWAMNWEYANETPTGEYCGQMTLARKLRVGRTGRGLRLISEFVGLEKLTARLEEVEGPQKLESETFLLEMEGTGTIVLSNEQGEELIVEVTEDEILADRSRAGEQEFQKSFPTPAYSALSVPRLRKDGRLLLVFDVSVLEVFADDGAVPVTMVAYPTKPYDRVAAEGAGKVRICQWKEQ